MERQENDAGRTKRVCLRILAGALLLLGVSAGGFLLYWGIEWFGLRPVITVEYGEAAPEASAFGSRADSYDLPAGRLLLGMNRVQLQLGDGSVRTGWIWVRDTKAPSASATERTISTKTILQPPDLIERLSDADVVRVSFAETPAFGTVGDYNVEILLEDGSGNRSSVTSLLHIRVAGDGLTAEAGSEIPPVRSFLYDDYEIESVSGLDDSVMHEPGEHEVSVTVDGQTYHTKLVVIDSVAPEADVTTLIVEPGTEVKPEDFLTEIRDASAVSASFLNEPLPDEREFQSIGIRLTDSGGNTSDVEAGLLFTKAKPLTVEARTTVLTPEECLPDSSFSNAEIIRPFVPDQPGTYAVTMIVDGEQEIALVEVVDTVAPVIRAKDTTRYLDHPVDLSSLCTELYDVTGTTVTSENEIDWTLEGTQSVVLTAVDAAGNRSGVSFRLTLVRDTEPPKLYGVRNRNWYVGEPVAYLSEVFAVDAVDGEAKVTVDASKVDRNKAGFYRVTYTAVDQSGNKTTASCTFQFVRSSVSEERLKDKARSIIDEIISPGMTMTQKLVAVYDYVYDHVRYTGYSNKNDWRKEAMRGFTKGTGDCFTFYATLRALLDEIEVPYMSVTRKGGYTRHFWVIVNVGTGWYHLDANHNHTAHWRCFMWTNKQCSSPAGFWNYERSVFPDIATEPFDVNAVIAAEKAAGNS